MRFSPHDYQDHALRWLIQRTILDEEEGAALFQDPGLGKTAQALLWFRLLRMSGLAQKCLIVAPLRVVHSVWPQEIAKWDQFKDLRVSKALTSNSFRSVEYDNSKRRRGPDMKFLPLTEEERMERKRYRLWVLRKRLPDLIKGVDINLVNTDGVDLLAKVLHKKELPWDVLIVDESSPFKTWGSDRTKALRSLVPRFKKRLILTGTPSPNGVQDLFSQIWIVDKGQTLGKNVTQHRSQFYHRGGFENHDWIPNDGATEKIEKLIAPLCLRMSAEDHLDLPELLINDVWVDLPSAAKGKYKQLEKELFLALENGEELVPMNAGARYGACKQIAGGGVYLNAQREALELHGAKVEAAVDIVAELQGKPCLIAFQYRHDLDRLRKVWKDLPSIDGSTSGEETDILVQKWNEGKLPLLAVQPQAISHGVNMQYGPGRDLIWFGLTDNLETYLQLNARIYRQGVTGQTRIHRILAKSTVDVAVRRRIEKKDGSQRALLQALNDYRKGV